MDAEQFKKLLTVFQEQQKILLTQLTAEFQANSLREVSVNISPFENFDPQREKFTCYLERFGNYVSMKNVNDKTKLAQLLCVSIGSVHYNNLAAFLGPDKPINTLDYDTLIQTFKEMLVPRKSVVVSQHYFLNIYQNEGQSVAEYVTNLKRNLADCEFSVKCECNKVISVADIFLRAQFIRGLRDNWLKEKLLQLEVTTFDNILAKATAFEASRIESRELNKQPVFMTSDYDFSDTNKVKFCHQSDQSNSIKDKPNRSQNKEFQNRSGSPSSSNSERSLSRARSRPDFRRLGIENLCFRCAKSNHRVNECSIDRSKVMCKSCGKVGHVSKVCITTLIKRQQDNSTKSLNSIQDDDSDTDYGIGKIEAIHCSTQEDEIVDLFEMSESDKYLITVLIEGKPQKFEVDSGARFSLLAEDDFHRLKLHKNLETSNINFRSYSGNIIKSKGKITVKVTYKGKEMYGELHIVPKGHDALLGRMWIRRLGIELQQIDADIQDQSVQSSPVNTLFSIEEIFKDFATIFEEKVGCVPKFEVKLELREGVKPVFTRERNVPYALRERVEKELNSLEAAGIISPVQTSDWGSPLVVIPKPDGGVRLCVDYKCGVNERLVNANHPIRKIDDVLNSLRNSKYFCKIDLYKAYLHLKVDNESSIIQTISTHRGTYRMNRLSFGIKTAPSEFNRILSQILRGLSKTEQYFDDIIIHGSTIQECAENLRSCLQRLQEHDLHVNRNKCSFFNEKIEYLGHIIELNKISKSPGKVQAIKEMPRPANVDDLRRFLGLVTYYSSFIPNLSTMTHPLRRLLCKGQRWFWTCECETAFLKLKVELQSDRIIVPYNPELPLVLTTDASPTGVGAILSHKIDGEEKPIAYASRSLTSAEKNYSQLDREALGIMFGVTRFFNYLFGKKFTLITDNEPLTRIFHPNKPLPQMTSARLLRYASFLSGFDYNVQFKKGKDNENVDCLSRASITQTKTSTDGLIGEEVNSIYSELIFQISSEQLTFKEICEETKNDPELSSIITDLMNTSKDSHYTINDGILFRNDRIVVPQRLRPQVLRELHDTHIGIMKMKQLARRYVYWPGIDQEIERLVKGCENCALTRTKPAKAPVHPWDEPKSNWERIHIDYAGPISSYYFLICIDAKSKWAEIKMIKDAPTSANTILLLNDICASHGFPHVIVSDNASIFQSEEFRNYCTSNGIFQKFIAPGHPATNGLAERNVQTLKQRLRAASNEPTSIREKLQKILFKYRATPLANGKSPAEQYLQRKLRIRLDAIFPYHPQASKVLFGQSRTFKVGERIQAQMFINNKTNWKFGIVKKKIGQRHYIVTLDSGRSLKKHVDQLRSTLVAKPKKTVTFGPTESFNVPRIPVTLLPQCSQEPQLASPLLQDIREPQDIQESQDIQEPPVIQEPQSIREPHEPQVTPNATADELDVQERTTGLNQPAEDVPIQTRRSRQKRLPLRFRDYVM